MPSPDYEAKVLSNGSLRGWLTEIERIQSWPQELQDEEKARLHDVLFNESTTFRF